MPSIRNSEQERLLSEQSMTIATGRHLVSELHAHGPDINTHRLIASYAATPVHRHQKTSSG